MRTTFCALALSGLFAANLAASPAAAQNYPNRNVTFVVTNTPGGLTDAGRALGSSADVDQPVDRNPWRRYALAANAVKSAAAVATPLVTETGMFTIQPFLAKDKPPYDLGKDFSRSAASPRSRWH
jgi:tripartite-type tricarboxylate transporter receptor subunit TctC